VATQLTVHPNNFSLDKASLVIYSHPNHELATFGLLQRLRPHMVLLTDGGSEERLQQTREGLSSIGLLDRATFLNHSEQEFYDALLRRDDRFFAGIAEVVRAHVTRAGAKQIFCDAVEFYNPVHDIGLPIAHAARKDNYEASLFELPLIFQTNGPGESLIFQRPPESRTTESSSIALSEEEFGAKVEARDHVYTILTQQLAPQLRKVPREHWMTEYVFPAREEVPRPGPDTRLRYERRAALLLERGDIAEPILYREHYIPVASSLFG
jgi:hypothetical protein